VRVEQSLDQKQADSLKGKTSP